MDTSVIIVGAGPAGLMLACELRLAGVDTVILERLRAPSGQSRGLGFNARTMEVLDQRGLLPLLGEMHESANGHFGGIPVDFSILDGAHFGAHGVPQARTEEVLAARAVELGADLRRGWTVGGLTQDGTGVTVDCGTPAGPSLVRGHYLVACDGGRSSVRRLAGFDFPGRPATLEMFLADVAGVEVAPRMIGDRRPNGMVMAGPLGDDVTRLIIYDREAPPRDRTQPTFAEVVDAWKRLTGEDIGAGRPVWMSAFGNASRQVTEYRRGRVLIAGDAAHIHLPAGGQGLNVSVQDVVNLGWKLAGVVHGWAGPALLDSYHDERHPVGRRLLMNTGAQDTVMLGDDALDPLRAVLAELISHDVVREHLAGMVSGIEVAYDVGSGSHPLLGRRLPHQDLVAADGPTSTTELLHPARGVLLDLGDREDVRAAAGPWHRVVDVVSAKPEESATSLAGLDALLLRPDGHVAWLAPGADADLHDALTRWFGPRRTYG